MRCAESHRRGRAWCAGSPPRPRCRGAFTLVEVLVALAIGAVVVLGARMLLDGLAVQAARTSTAARDADIDANGERLLQRLVRDIEVGPSPAPTFGGDRNTAHFSSWCEVPRGWLEPCRVSLGIESAVDGVAVVARLSTGEAIVVRRASRADGLRYLLSSDAGGVWLEHWDGAGSAPLAIGVLVDGDTLILPIGESG